MRKAWPIVKREFMEMARTKMYIIGTLLGPLLIAALFVLPILFLRSGGGGERTVLILDASGTGVGQEIAAVLDARADAAEGGLEGRISQFTAEVREVSAPAETERREARDRIGAEGAVALDGYLYLPPGFMDGERALYEGRNATSLTQMERFERLVTQAVQTRRLNEAGVEPQVLAQVLRPVRMERRKPGSAEEEGAGAEASMLLGYLMAMAVYFAVVLFAASVMRGVLEEKRDRIVEVLLSSVEARHFIVGKVTGIGGASLLQMLVWVGFAAAAIMYAPVIAERHGLPVLAIPSIPGSIAIVFLFFFMTGFLLYAAMFGAAGAIATSDQEANQLQFPVTIPLLIGIFMLYAVLADADSATAVAGSLIPFTAPVVMPFRAMMTSVPTAQYVLAGALMLATVAAVTWAAAKIYRIAVLSTGKRPTLKELGRWLRTA